MVNVAINGFGRIGRNTLRAAIREGIFDEINYVAINDPGLYLKLTLYSMFLKTLLLKKLTQH